MKDSQLSQHGHAILFLPFVIAIFDTLGLDLILYGPTYERHSRVPTQGGSLSYDFFFCRALRSERGSKRRRHLPCASLRWFAARLSALVDALVLSFSLEPVGSHLDRPFCCCWKFFRTVLSSLFDLCDTRQVVKSPSAGSVRITKL
jgi:hypothetical protein